MSTTIVNGHQAALYVSSQTRTGPGSAIRADRWLSWRLANGRYINVWEEGADDSALRDFVATFTEGPAVQLPRSPTIEATVPGLTELSISEGGAGGAVDAILSLCPPGTATATDTLDGDPAPLTCIQVSASRSQAERIGLGRGDGSYGTTKYDGTDVRTAANGMSAWAVSDGDTDDALGRSVNWSPHLSPIDLAALLMSVAYPRG